MKLFVVTHKVVNEIPEGRVLIGVGPNKPLENVEIYDDVGENIAQKNPNYCELTALYWMWKNCTDDIVGLEHYQRFFCKDGISKFKEAVPLSQEEIAAILSEHDMILPQKVKTRKSVYQYYRDAKVYYSFEKAHCIEDLDICIDIINQHFPQYKESCDRVMKSHAVSMCNMFIGHKEFVDEYCEWLFSIFAHAEGRIDLEHKTQYQKRVFGFLSERLFNVWLDHKGLNYYYAPVHNLHEVPFRNKIRGRGVLRRIKNLFKKK